MSRHHQPFKPSWFQRGPLPEHGEDLQQLHCGPGESGGHLHGRAPRPVLPQGKDCTLLAVEARNAHHRWEKVPIIFFHCLLGGLKQVCQTICPRSSQALHLSYRFSTDK